MSLAERLNTIEDYESLSGQASPIGSPRRKLSFSPIGEWAQPAPHVKPIGAFEVSKAKRVLQVGLAVAYCLLASGVVFGYAAIKPVLVEEGAYRQYCTKQELEDNVRVCYEQEIRLNFMFTIAAVSTNVVALPVGTILDMYGPRVCGIIGSVFITLGSVMLAFANEVAFDAFIPGYLLLALGGPFIFISSFQLSNTFPKYSGLILALLTGAFDTSSAIFLMFRLIYTGTLGSFSLKYFFLLYLVAPLFILLAQLLVMPSQSYKTIGELTRQAEDEDDLIANETEDQHAQHPGIEHRRHSHRESVVSEITALLGEDGKDRRVKKEDEKRHLSGVWGVLHGRTATQQILTPWFILIALFTVVQMTRINYFVATVRSQYEYMLGDFTRAVQVNNFFDIALPLGGVLSIPFIGLILDNTSTPFVLGLLVTIATSIGALGLVPEMWAAYANICLFVVYRPFYYTAVSDYSAKVFGFTTFGKVYGLIICLAGFLNFSQSGLDAITLRQFAGNPQPVNVALLSLALVVGLSLVGFVWRKSKIVTHDQLQEEAEGAEDQRLIPNLNDD